MSYNKGPIIFLCTTGGGFVGIAGALGGLGHRTSGDISLATAIICFVAACILGLCDYLINRQKPPNENCAACTHWKPSGNKKPQGECAMKPGCFMGHTITKNIDWCKKFNRREPGLIVWNF
jgi:hypothetical protein